MAKRPIIIQQGAPEWVLTYGDMMSLLLCFFIALVSMSEIKQDRFQQAVESLQRAFGGFKGGIGTMPIETNTANTMIQKLMELEVPILTDKAGDSDEEGIHGRKFRVTNVRDGLQVVVGGRIAFGRFEAELKPEARELIVKTAEQLRGYNTRILVRGHTTHEPLPADSIYDDKRDLAYARARAVSDALEANGVRAIRIIPIAVGDAEPFVRQAYTEERRALNRRVEILVTENLVKDYAGSAPANDQKGTSDGG
ncbi:MAG: OmpA family protein [Planctomycetes bacterium]|nr:OmpA family protein [Planctomycetota bacterium]